MRSNRRALLLAAGALVASPMSAWAQAKEKRARIGYLFEGPDRAAISLPLLVDALRELRWVEGRNLTIERRFANGIRERLPELAAELAQREVQVIVTPLNGGAEAARRAAPSIPIVMLSALDPVGAGLAQSLAKPAGNVTGVLYADPALSAKAVQLMKEAFPSVKRIGLLYPTAFPGLESYIVDMEAAARALGLTVHRLPLARPEDIGTTLTIAKKERVDALRISYLGAVTAVEGQVREFAAANGLPDMSTNPVYVERGGLMSYSPRFPESAKRGAALVDRILNGAKPAELPFEYPTQNELVINLKAARARGLSIPRSFLLRGDRVIE